MPACVHAGHPRVGPWVPVSRGVRTVAGCAVAESTCRRGARAAPEGTGGRGRACARAAVCGVRGSVSTGRCPRCGLRVPPTRLGADWLGAVTGRPPPGAAAAAAGAGARVCAASRLVRRCVRRCVRPAAGCAGEQGARRRAGRCGRAQGARRPRQPGPAMAPARGRLPPALWVVTAAAAAATCVSAARGEGERRRRRRGGAGVGGRRGAWGRGARNQSEAQLPFPRPRMPKELGSLGLGGRRGTAGETWGQGIERWRWGQD